MGADSLTTRAAEACVEPIADGGLWVSASATRNHLLRATLLDWLNLYGEARGFVRDSALPGYDERLEFAPFLMQKGSEFEDAIVNHLRTLTEVRTIAESRESIRDPAAMRQTFEALADGVPMVHQGVLWDAESKTYGAADLMVRSDVFAGLFPGHVSDAEAAVGASGIGGRWHYLVVDVKYTTLHLLASGELGNGGSSQAYKAQLYVYNRALGRMQGYTPPTAFLLGRGWSQTLGGRTKRGTNALERLGPVPMTAGTSASVDAACEWLRRLRLDGSDWSPLPEPTVRELWPNAGGECFPWSDAVSRIAGELGDLTLLWYVGPDKRDAAHRQGVSSWRDPRASAALLGVTGAVTGRTLQAILDVNRDADGPPVRPERVRALEEEWRPEPVLEFFVDFETVNNLDDDFSRIPEQNGQSLIFMIGCGHVRDGEWVFRCFMADQLTEAAEEEMIDAWLNHMDDVALPVGVGNPKIVHWSYAEPVNYQDAYDSACARHPGRAWPDLNWFDLWANVVRKEPVVVRGALNFGLKAFARALYSHGLIETSWGDTNVDGLGAMTSAWWCGGEARRLGAALHEVDPMQEVVRYNEVDCKAMMEMLGRLRLSH